MADSKKYDGSQWEHSLRKLTTATEAIENPLYSDGTAITAYTIKGNTVQSGTPTPSAPISVNGVGNKTANLLNPSTLEDNKNLAVGTGLPVDLNGRFATVTPIDVSNINNVTFTYTTALQQIRFIYSILDSNNTLISRVAGNASGTSIDTSNADILYICVYSDSGALISKSDVTELMVSEGSTALPYVPYGYKIPISSAGQTIDIYIGDLPLLKSLDGTAVDEISNDTLTRRVDSDGSVLPTPTTTQITMPSIPTTGGANSITVDTTVQPSEFTATWTGWHDASVKEYDGSDWQ